MNEGEDYRSALGAAQRRIDVLERELQQTRELSATPHVTPVWVTVLAGLGGLCGLGLFLGVGLCAMQRLGRPQLDEAYSIPAGPAPAASERPAIGARWYAADTKPNLTGDLNGDGKRDLVALFWDAPRDTPLYAAAVDRETLKPIWTAGPYPSQWAGRQTHLVVTDSFVLVSDSRETLHVLDGVTGKSVHDLTFPQGAQHACRVVGQADGILVSRNYNDFQLLDPAAGTLRKPGKNEHLECADEHRWCKPGVAQPCSLEDPGVVARSKVRGLQAYSSLLDGDLRFTEGTVLASHDRGIPWLVVSDVKGKASRWAAPAVLEGDSLHLTTNVDSELATGFVVSFYQRSVGDFRLLGRNAADGSVAWSTQIQGTAEGSTADMHLLDGEIFVFADHSMHAYTLSTGIERRVSSGI